MASSDKLNKVAQLYHAASAIGPNGRPSGGNAEDLEEAREKDEQDNDDAESEAAGANGKASKNLDFTQGRGGLRTTIYDNSK